MAAVFLIAAAPSLTAAQVAPIPIDSLARGTEIRLWSREPDLKAWRFRYRGRTDTSLVVAVRSSSRAPDDEFPLSRIDHVEVATGRQRNGNYASRCMLTGAGIGAAAGIGLVAAFATGQTSDDEGGLAVVTVGATALGALGGMVVGGVVSLRGATVWTRVRIP